MKKLLLSNLLIQIILYTIRLRHKETEEGLQFTPSRLIGVLPEKENILGSNESGCGITQNNFIGYKSQMPNKFEKMISKMKPISLEKRLNIDVIREQQNDPFAITRILCDAFKNQKEQLSKVLLHVKSEEAHNMVVHKLKQSAPELVEGFDALGKQIISKLKLNDEFSEELMQKVKSSPNFDNFKPNLPNQAYKFKDTVSFDKFENVKHVSSLKRVLRKDIPIYPDIHEVGERVEIKAPFHKLFKKVVPETIVPKPKKNPMEKTLEEFFETREKIKKIKKQKSLIKKLILFLKKFFRLFYISPIKVKKFIKAKMPKRIAGLFIPMLNRLKLYNKFIRTIVLLFMGILISLGLVGLIYLIIKLIIYLIEKIKKFYDENCKEKIKKFYDENCKNFLVRSNNYNYIVNKLNLQNKKKKNDK